jgi:hypothetical protein
VNCQDFTLDHVQTAIFTPEHSSFASGRAVGVILAKFRERFDGEMQVLPIPNEVPVDIPRVVLQSQDGRWRLTMSPARFDVIWKRDALEEFQDLGSVAMQCAEVQEHYMRETSIRAGRVALVISRICPTPNPAGELIKRFCNQSSQSQPFNRSESFEIHHQKVYVPKELPPDCKINSWVRCKSARLLSDNSPVILVEQDLNTLAEDIGSRRFDPDQIGAFFRVAVREADDILDKYFPRETTQ